MEREREKGDGSDSFMTGSDATGQEKPAHFYLSFYFLCPEGWWVGGTSSVSESQESG